jgi:hypothetical protein
MPVYTMQTNFTAGEMAPSMDARLDFTRYHNSAELLHNWITKPTGGAVRRAGTFFVHGVYDHTQITYLIPFIFSREQAYVLELSPFTMRFYRNRALLKDDNHVPILVRTPWTGADLLSIRYAQSGDVMYFASTAHPPQKLLRIELLKWELREVRFDPPPSIEAPFPPNTILTPGTGAMTPDAENVTFTASASVFLAGDKNKLLTSGAGRAIIRTVSSATTVLADILDPYSSLAAIQSGNWFLFGSPNSKVTVSAAKPDREKIVVTTDMASFRTTDAGSFVRMNRGLVALTKYNSSTSMAGRIVRSLDPTSATPALTSDGGAWTLEVPSWSATRGYPGVVSFHEQRAMYAATKAEPLTFWGSVTGDFENFALGPNDDNAIEYALAIGDFDRIRSMVPLRQLMIGSPGGEFSAHGATDSPITPASIVVRQESAVGEDINVGPLRLGQAILYLQRGAQRIFEQSYDFTRDSVKSIDLTAVAEHLVINGGGITGLAKQVTPLPYLFAVRADGLMLCCMYDRDQEVVSWSRFMTGPAQDLSDGHYESVCVIPNSCGDGDEVWCVTARLNAYGDTRRRVEVFDGQLQTDCARVAIGNNIDTITGLFWLDEMPVQVVIDGEIAYDMVVHGQQITLPPGITSNRIEVGLHYRSTLRTMRPETSASRTYIGGTAQSRLQRVNRVAVRFYCTGPGCTVGGESEASRQLYVPDPTLRTEDYIRERLGWDRFSRITVNQDQPFSVTVLGIIREIEVGEGEEDDAGGGALLRAAQVQQQAQLGR